MRYDDGIPEMKPRQWNKQQRAHMAEIAKRGVEIWNAGNDDDDGSSRPHCVVRRLMGVRCVETGKTFDSVTHAAEWAGCSVSAISHATTRRCAVFGFHWERLGAKLNRGGGLARPVRCVETKEVFLTLLKAAAAVKRSDVSISVAARCGTKCARLHWEFVKVDGDVIETILN